MKRTLAREVILLIAMAVVVGFVFNAFTPGGLPVIRETPEKIAVADSTLFGDTAPAGASAVSAGDDGGGAEVSGDSGGAPLRIISLRQLVRILDERKGMVIDARTPEEYAEGHIATAVNMYAMEPEGYFERIVEIPRDSLIVVYCSNPHCHFARSLAGFLGDFGFSNILLYDDGWDAWTEAGMPVEVSREDEQ